MQKKYAISVIFLVFCFLTVGSEQAWAEGFMDIYGGFVKSIVFGLVITWFCSFIGYYFFDNLFFTYCSSFL